MNTTGRRDLVDVCRRSLEWAEQRDYVGFNKHDGLNSPLLRALSLGRKWPRILCIQAVMRSPVNIRRLIGVRQARNPKGIALFARAWLNLFRLTGEARCRGQAQNLLDWLVDNPNREWSGFSWGYPYPWQDPGFYAPAGSPNRIVTYFVGRALVHAYECLGERRYLDAAQRAVEFILQAPKRLFDTPQMLCVSYVPSLRIRMAVLDVPALCGALCASVARHTDDASLMSEAERLIRYVVDKQTHYGAWFYTHPPGDSHLKHDNYHTGEILDALHEYEYYSGDNSFREAYRRGLEFYRSRLFTREGRPKWTSDQTHPHDVHGYSQGIITFATSGELGLSEKIARLAIEEMRCPREGRFYYQRRRFYTIRLTLMRWCQAWMAFALSHLAYAVEDATRDLPRR